MSLLLVCGFHGTGKDHFYSSYSKCDSSHWMIFGLTPFSIKTDVKRLSHADIMKTMCHEQYGLNSILQSLSKDQALPSGLNGIPNDIVTLRDLYIMYSSKFKEIDINYWCKQVNIDHSHHYVLTDFRFPHEYQYAIDNYHDMDLATLRVYRSQVVEPPANMDTEHNLDEFQTTFLAVTSQCEFEIAVQRFPQYQNYTYQCSI